jgi:hypothetical protein
MSINLNDAYLTKKNSKILNITPNNFKGFELVSNINNSESNVDLISIIQNLLCEVKSLKKDVHILKQYLGHLIDEEL